MRHFGGVLGYANWNSFYEAQGFVLVDDFVAKRPDKDFGDFEGALLRMDI